MDGRSGGLQGHVLRCMHSVVHSSMCKTSCCSLCSAVAKWLSYATSAQHLPAALAPAAPCVQDLQRWRQNVRQESLRQAVLPPEIAAQISTAAAVQMRKEG